MNAAHRDFLLRHREVTNETRQDKERYVFVRNTIQPGSYWYAVVQIG